MTKYSREEFLTLTQDINPNIEIIGEFINLRTQIKIKCKKHNHVWYGYPTSILKGCGCKYCKKEKISSSLGFSVEDFMNRLDSHIEVLGSYINSTTKILVKDKRCGHEWNAFPNNLMRGSSCPVCSRHYVDNNSFLKKLYSTTKDIEPLEQYLDNKTKIKCRCLVCGRKFEKSPVKLYSGQGCPFCGKSKGEKCINDYLSSVNVSFERQKQYVNLRGVNNGLLSYDFFLPDYNLLIEYQGEYHDGTSRNQTEDMLAKQIEHDKRKRDYAKEHDIELLEIWYYDYDNIEQILNEKLHINNIEKSA